MVLLYPRFLPVSFNHPTVFFFVLEGSITFNSQVLVCSYILTNSVFLVTEYDGAAPTAQPILVEYDPNTNRVTSTTLDEGSVRNLKYSSHHVLHNRNKEGSVQIINFDSSIAQLKRITSNDLTNRLGELFSNFPRNNGSLQQKNIGQVRLMSVNCFTKCVPQCALKTDASIKSVLLEKLIYEYDSAHHNSLEMIIILVDSRTGNVTQDHTLQKVVVDTIFLNVSSVSKLVVPIQDSDGDNRLTNVYPFFAAKKESIDFDFVQSWNPSSVCAIVNLCDEDGITETTKSKLEEEKEEEKEQQPTTSSAIAKPEEEKEQQPTTSSDVADPEEEKEQQPTTSSAPVPEKKKKMKKMKKRKEQVQVVKSANGSDITFSYVDEVTSSSKAATTSDITPSSVDSGCMAGGYDSLSNVCVSTAFMNPSVNKLVDSQEETKKMEVVTQKLHTELTQFYQQRQQELTSEKKKKKKKRSRSKISASDSIFDCDRFYPGGILNQELGEKNSYQQLMAEFNRQDKTLMKEYNASSKVLRNILCDKIFKVPQELKQYIATKRNASEASAAAAEAESYYHKFVRNGNKEVMTIKNLMCWNMELLGSEDDKSLLNNKSWTDILNQLCYEVKNKQEGGLVDHYTKKYALLASKMSIKSFLLKLRKDGTLPAINYISEIEGSRLGEESNPIKVTNTVLENYIHFAVSKNLHKYLVLVCLLTAMKDLIKAMLDIGGVGEKTEPLIKLDLVQLLTSGWMENKNKDLTTELRRCIVQALTTSVNCRQYLFLGNMSKVNTYTQETRFNALLHPLMSGGLFDKSKVSSEMGSELAETMYIKLCEDESPASVFVALSLNVNLVRDDLVVVDILEQVAACDNEVAAHQREVEKRDELLTKHVQKDILTGVISSNEGETAEELVRRSKKQALPRTTTLHLIMTKIAYFSNNHFDFGRSMSARPDKKNGSKAWNMVHDMQLATNRYVVLRYGAKWLDSKQKFNTIFHGYPLKYCVKIIKRYMDKKVFDGKCLHDLVQDKLGENETMLKCLLREMDDEMLTDANMWLYSCIKLWYSPFVCQQLIDLAYGVDSRHNIFQQSNEALRALVATMDYNMTVLPTINNIKVSPNKQLYEMLTDEQKMAQQRAANSQTTWKNSKCRLVTKETTPITGGDSKVANRVLRATKYVSDAIARALVSILDKNVRDIENNHYSYELKAMSQTFSRLLAFRLENRSSRVGVGARSVGVKVANLNTSTMQMMQLLFSNFLSITSEAELMTIVVNHYRMFDFNPYLPFCEMCRIVMAIHSTMTHEHKSYILKQLVERVYPIEQNVLKIATAAKTVAAAAAAAAAKNALLPKKSAGKF